MKQTERRDQIVEITLELLRSERIEQVTTRRIAQRVGVSQPALFRHFLNREAILIAVVMRARGHLSTVAADILKADGKAMDALSQLCFALLSYVEENPGISRILFYDVANGKEETLRLQLRKLIKMQLSLVRTLISEAIESEELPHMADSRQMADQWLALVSGTVLQWQIGDRKGPLASRSDQLMRCWLFGVKESCLAEKLAPMLPERGLLALLDVEPVLRDGQDPLDNILLALDGIDSCGLLVLHIPFFPKPLLALMERRGHQTRCEEHDSDGWEVWIHGRDAETVLDLRELPIPEPMEHLLSRISALKEQEFVLARTPRIPSLLLERLSPTEYETMAVQTLDGSGLVGIRKR
jgi:AcrR family transcriptional regulator